MPSIKVKKRTKEEKPKKIRKEGQIPAVLYGPEVGNILLKLDLKDFKEVYKSAGETTLISLEFDDGKKYEALIHDWDTDPITGEFIHVDFFQPSLKEETEVEVPLKFVGESPAVKNFGGILVKEMTEIEVRGLPQNLPHEIEVDISKLKNIDDEIKVSDLKVPEGIKILRGGEEVVALVVAPEKEEIEERKEETIEEVEEEKKEPSQPELSSEKEGSKEKK